MTDFITPSRYDQTLANKGISIAVEENGAYYGTFDVKCYDPFSPFFKVARERYLRNYKAEIKLIKDEQSRAIHQFIYLAVFGWKDIKNSQGEVTFSKESAYKFMTETGIGLYVYVELLNQASNIENFKAPDVDADEDEDHSDPMTSVDEVAKN